MAAPYWTGQRALQPLPSKSLSEKRGISSYHVAENLLLDVQSSDQAGLAVFKVNKNGKLQSRRIAVSADRLSILVTTHRVRGWKGLIKKAFSSTASVTGPAPSSPTQQVSSSSSPKSIHPIKRIPIESIDRIQRGTNTRRFLQWMAQRNQKSLSLKIHDLVSPSHQHDRQHHFDDASTMDGSIVTTATSVRNLKESEYRQAEYLSVVYSSATSGQLETLDLVVVDPKDYEVLLTALEDLVALYRTERQRYSTGIQFLRYHWMETLYKPSYSPITLSEWMTLADAMQVNLKKSVLQNIFQSEAKFFSASGRTSSGSSSSIRSTSNGSNDGTEEPLLSFQCVADICEEIKDAAAVDAKQDPLQQLWHELLETDPVPFVGLACTSTDDDASLELSIHEQEQSLSAVALQSFLRTHQKTDLSLAQVTDLIHVLNLQQTADNLQQQQHHFSKASLVPPGKSNEADNNRFSFASSFRKKRKKWKSVNKSASGIKANKSRTFAKPIATASPYSGTPLSSGDRLNKARFLGYLASDCNDLLDPAQGKIGVHDMSLPLHNYWIHTTHDTYLQPVKCSSAGKNIRPTEIVDEQQYTAALLRGVRCLELDVWESHWSKEPVICRRRPDNTSSTISLSVVLQAVRHFLQSYPHSFPVLLKLENHCSAAAQLKVAQLFYDILGAAELMIVPRNVSLQAETAPELPSPEAARGKAILIAKRPKKLSPCKVVNDDYDDENDVWEAGTTSQEILIESQDEDDEPSAEQGDQEGSTVVGFDSRGPIRTNNPDAVKKSPAELLEECERDCSAAQRKSTDAKLAAVELAREAGACEREAAELTQKAGMAPAEVRKRAAAAAQRSDSDYFDIDLGEEKSPKDEGIEIYQVLPNFVEEERDRYAQAAQAALEAKDMVRVTAARLEETAEVLSKATHDLDQAEKREVACQENAKRAAVEARSHWEHAETAKQRVEQVRQLLVKSQDLSSSAGTVVVTALTEAKISEKRALDAEARAARAAQSAEKERARADAETRKEEILEQEVGDQHTALSRASDIIRSARQRMDKSLQDLDRCSEQIKLIESAAHYKEEVTNRVSKKTKGSFVAKHAAKVEEQEALRISVKQASEELVAAENNRSGLQKLFEEKSNAWKRQAEQASHYRKCADRSAHMAEELAEHAEEEREAATLRHFARQRAEQAVQNRGSQKESVQAQLAEAERASAEAARLATTSRQRAELLRRQAEKAANREQQLRAVEQAAAARDQAVAAFEQANKNKDRADAAVQQEKQRLDAAAEVYLAASKQAEQAVDKIRVAALYEQEAVISYNKAILLRQQASQAAQHASATEELAAEQQMAVQRARQYYQRVSSEVEIPVLLAKLTAVHSSKYRHVQLIQTASHQQSAAVSAVHCVSIANTVLSKLHELADSHSAAPTEKNLRQFTANHLCRVFPAPKLGLETNSNPLTAWSAGCQLVGCRLYNHSQHCHEHLLHDGWFRQNGSCGYVLKPAHLRNATSKVPGVDQRWKFVLLAAFHLPKPTTTGSSNAAVGSATAVQPTVKVSLQTAGGEDGKDQYRLLAQTKPDPAASGLYQSWKLSTPGGTGESSSSFDFTVTPAGRCSGLLLFEVPCCNLAASIPVSCLRQGYRSVALFHPSENARRQGVQYATLLVKVVQVPSRQL